MTTKVPAELDRKMDEAIGHYPVEQKRSAALPLMHLWQEHFGFISDEGVNWIAAKLGLEPINILELVTFYPMFRQAPAGRKHIRVCRTLSCAMAGAYPLMEKLAALANIDRAHHVGGMHTPVAVSPDGEYSIEFVECLASCGTAPVCMVDDELHENVAPDRVSTVTRIHDSQFTIESPAVASRPLRQAPLPHPLERRLIFQNIGREGYTTDIDCYLQNGGYEQLKIAVKMSRAEIVNEVKSSGLRGRGGAGFPCGVKWSFIKPDEKNCLPDLQRRRIRARHVQGSLHHLPGPTSANRGDVDQLLRPQRPYRLHLHPRRISAGAKIPEHAIEEARSHNFLGKDGLGLGFDVEIYIHRGAGAYICGEETGLIESLEGKRAYPRIKPPYFPAVLGLYMCPTIVNNVETLCHVKHIIAMGGAEYARIGRPNNTGTRIVCVSGDVVRPGISRSKLGR